MQGFLIFQKVCTDILTHSLLVFHFKCKYGNDRKIMLHDEGVCICPMEVTLRREKGGDLKAVLTDISIRQPDPCQSTTEICLDRASHVIQLIISKHFCHCVSFSLHCHLCLVSIPQILMVFTKLYHSTKLITQISPSLRVQERINCGK